MALRLILRRSWKVPLHCSYKMFTLCSISGDHLHLMTIQKIKRMIQTLDQPCSLLQIFSKARLDSSQGVLIILPPAAGCCTLSILSWSLMWKVGPAEALVAVSALKGCAKWPGRIPRWTRQSALYQQAGKAPALS